MEPAEIKIIRKSFGLNQTEFGEMLGVGIRSVQNWESGKRNMSESVKILLEKKIKEKELLIGNDEMLINEKAPEPIITKNKHEHIPLPNGQYIMKVPLLNIPAQAGFCCNYQDVEFLTDIQEFHTIIVDAVHRGRYFAFVVRNDSMDNGDSESILPNDIVTCRELSMTHWRDELWYKKRPYWVIATRESKYPLLKQIVNHNTEKGIITCHSLNESPEYEDFDLCLNDVTGLFYVVDRSRKF